MSGGGGGTLAIPIVRSRSAAIGRPVVCKDAEHKSAGERGAACAQPRPALANSHRSSGVGGEVVTAHDRATLPAPVRGLGGLAHRVRARRGVMDPLAAYRDGVDSERHALGDAGVLHDPWIVPRETKGALGSSTKGPFAPENAALAEETAKAHEAQTPRSSAAPPLLLSSAERLRRDRTRGPVASAKALAGLSCVGSAIATAYVTIAHGVREPATQDRRLATARGDTKPSGPRSRGCHKPSRPSELQTSL